jgi:ubiquitin carboxyl-terminal hydrolase 7
MSAENAFASRYLSDMGQEVEDFSVFTWKIKDYRKMAKRITSPEFDCGGHKW